MDLVNGFGRASMGFDSDLPTGSGRVRGSLQLTFFFSCLRAQSSSSDGRLVGSSIAMSDTLFLERGNKACSREREHT